MQMETDNRQEKSDTDRSGICRGGSWNERGLRRQGFNPAEGRVPEVVENSLEETRYGMLNADC